MKIKLLILLLLSTLLFAHNTEQVGEMYITHEELHLTDEEHEYLSLNKTIPLCLHPNIFPIDGFEDGKHTGIMSDIYLEISKILGVEFVPIVSKGYIELNNNIKNKNCKLVSVLPTKNKRENKLNMTQPFFTTYFTLVSNVNKSFIRNPADLKGKKLIVRFKAHKDKILDQYPYLDIEVFSDIDIIMYKVLNNKVFAVITVNESSDYLIDRYGRGRLKINGFISKENLVSGSIGVLKGETVLYSIMQKVLSSIPKQKISDIIKEWRLTRYHTETDYSIVWKIMVFMSIILGIMWYYQSKLKRANKELAKTVDELRTKDEILTVQSKQAVMGEMISMIAHQWRQPLSNITLQISNLQIKRMIDEKEIDEKEIDITLSEISDSIIYLSQTIDDFKTYFHPDRKTVNIELHELLQKVVNFALPRVKGKKIEIIILESNNLFVDIHVNELIQVILNILNNAIDALTQLQKDDKQIKLYLKSKGDKVAIYIEDNANGIESENISKLFEPYFSTKGKNGTGLGLYMSQMIIQKQLAGDIFVRTSKNGSIFIIEIPK